MMPVLFILLLPLLLLAQAKPLLTWVVNDAAPYYIDQGELQGQGFGDLTQQQIIQAMPAYEHVITKKPLSRVMKDFEHGKPVCFSTWIYASTPDIAVTTIPNIYYPPLGIITAQKKQQRFGQLPVSLKQTMQAGVLVFGQAKGRGYGEPLDSIVEPQRDKPHFKVRSAHEDPTEGLLKMIEYGRIDYTIDYPHALSYYEQLTGRSNRLAYLPLQENNQNGVLGAIACSRSDWGEQTVKAMNAAILKVRENPQYQAILERWLVLDGNKDSYWSQYRKQVLSIQP